MPDPPSAQAPEARPAPVPLRRVGPSERITATLALSMIGFGVLILGVAFSQEDAAPVVPTLDVILTQTTTTEAPDRPDFIAQANNKGGGDRDEARRPRDPSIGQVPKPQPGVAPQPLTAQAPLPAPEPTQRIVSTSGASADKTPLPEEHPRTEPTPLPTGQELMQQSLEMARLQAELDRKQELYAKRPKRKFISASTTAYEYATYMRSWVEKVERVGNLNYPEEARRQGLSGRPILTVSVARNGEVKGVVLQRSSGRKILDDAAINIVRLASPYAPLPHTSEDIDILDITRTFDFRNGSVESE
jgi:periplasmic protein TonB